jgi:hypothetical protein
MEKRMNKKLSKLLVTGVLTAITLPSTLAAAGSEGHGGNAIICNGKSPVVLDYYSATLSTLGGSSPQLVVSTQPSPSFGLEAIAAS